MHSSLPHVVIHSSHAVGRTGHEGTPQNRAVEGWEGGRPAWPARGRPQGRLRALCLGLLLAGAGLKGWSCRHHSPCFPVCERNTVSVVQVLLGFTFQWPPKRAPRPVWD